MSPILWIMLPSAGIISILACLFPNWLKNIISALLFVYLWSVLYMIKLARILFAIPLKIKGAWLHYLAAIDLIELAFLRSLRLIPGHVLFNLIGWLLLAILVILIDLIFGLLCVLLVLAFLLGAPVLILLVFETLLVPLILLLFVCLEILRSVPVAVLILLVIVVIALLLPSSRKIFLLLFA